MPTAIKQFAVFRGIRAPGEDARYDGFRYLNDVENAKKIAMCDCMAATAMVRDAETPLEDRSGVPPTEIYVGRVDLPALVLLEKKRGGAARITVNAAGHREVILNGERKNATPPNLCMTDIRRLTYDEFGEPTWTPSSAAF